MPTLLVLLAIVQTTDFDSTLDPPGTASATPVRNWLGRGGELIMWKLGEPMPAWVARQEAARAVAEAMLAEEAGAPRVRRATLVGAIRQDEPPVPQPVQVPVAGPSYQAPPQAPPKTMPMPQAAAPPVLESTPWPQAAPGAAYAAGPATYAAGWPVTPPPAPGASYAPPAAFGAMPVRDAYPAHAFVVPAAQRRRGLFGGLFGRRAARPRGCGPWGCP